MATKTEQRIQDAYERGVKDTLEALVTSTAAAAQVGVSRAWLTRVAVRQGIGRVIAGDRYFLPVDIDRLRTVLASGPGPGQPKKTKGPAAT